MDWLLAIAIVSFLAAVFIVLRVWQRCIARAQHRQIPEQSQRAQNHGSDQPLAQHPQINPYRCLGCSSCVRACPEHGALAVIQGRARLVHPSRCVGHGYCEQACPVGALTVGLGDVSSRPDVPILSTDLETSVPGVFIAGELGGIALIHHAIEQGCRVVREICRRLEAEGVPPGDRDPPNVLIVGSGPAGIAAALAVAEHGLSYIIIDESDLGGTVRKYPRKKLVLTRPVELPLFGRMKRTQYTKEELIELWERVCREAEIQVRQGVRFTGLDRPADGTLLARTSAGTVHCRYLILALGRRGTPRRLGVPGEESERVLYELTDAADHMNEDILVVGGGDSAVEAALALAVQPGNRVTLSYRREGFFRLKGKNQERIETFRREGRISVLLKSHVKRIETGRVILTVEEADRTRELLVAADYVFVLAGGEPPYPFLKSIGIRFGNETEAKADAIGSRQEVHA